MGVAGVASLNAGTERHFGGSPGARCLLVEGQAGVAIEGAASHQSTTSSGIRRGERHTCMSSLNR